MNDCGYFFVISLTCSYFTEGQNSGFNLLQSTICFYMNKKVKIPSHPDRVCDHHNTTFKTLMIHRLESVI